MPNREDVTYVSPSSDQVYIWFKAGLCVWCGGKCAGDQCRIRKCDSCSEYWLADQAGDLDDGQPAHEYCPPCQTYLNHVHAVNPDKPDHIDCGSLIDAEIKVGSGDEVTCPECRSKETTYYDVAPTVCKSDVRNYVKSIEPLEWTDDINEALVITLVEQIKQVGSAVYHACLEPRDILSWNEAPAGASH